MKHSLIRKCTEAETAEEGASNTRKKLRRVFGGKRKEVESRGEKEKSGMRENQVEGWHVVRAAFCPLPGDSPFARLMQMNIIDRPERGLILSPFIYMFTLVPVTPFSSINTTLSIRLLVRWMGTSLAYLTRLGDLFLGWWFYNRMLIEVKRFFKKIPAVRASTSTASISNSSTNMLYSPTSKHHHQHKNGLRHHNMTHD